MPRSAQLHPPEQLKELKAADSRRYRANTKAKKEEAARLKQEAETEEKAQKRLAEVDAKKQQKTKQGTLQKRKRRAVLAEQKKIAAMNSDDNSTTNNIAGSADNGTVANSNGSTPRQLQARMAEGTWSAQDVLAIQRMRDQATAQGQEYDVTQTEAQREVTMAFLGDISAAKKQERVKAMQFDLDNRQILEKAGVLGPATEEYTQLADNVDVTTRRLFGGQTPDPRPFGGHTPESIKRATPQQRVPDTPLGPGASAAATASMPPIQEEHSLPSEEQKPSSSSDKPGATVAGSSGSSRNFKTTGMSPTSLGKSPANVGLTGASNGSTGCFFGSVAPAPSTGVTSKSPEMKSSSDDDERKPAAKDSTKPKPPPTGAGLSQEGSQPSSIFGSATVASAPAPSGFAFGSAPTGLAGPSTAVAAPTGPTGPGSQAPVAGGSVFGNSNIFGKTSPSSMFGGVFAKSSSASTSAAKQAPTSTSATKQAPTSTPAAKRAPTPKETKSAKRCRTKSPDKTPAKNKHENMFNGDKFEFGTPGNGFTFMGAAAGMPVNGGAGISGMPGNGFPSMGVTAGLPGNSAGIPGAPGYGSGSTSMGAHGAPSDVSTPRRSDVTTRISNTSASKPRRSDMTIRTKSSEPSNGPSNGSADFSSGFSLGTAAPAPSGSSNAFGSAAASLTTAPPGGSGFSLRSSAPTVGSTVAAATTSPFGSQASNNTLFEKPLIPGKPHFFGSPTSFKGSSSSSSAKRRTDETMIIRKSKRQQASEASVAGLNGFGSPGNGTPTLPSTPSMGALASTPSRPRTDVTVRTSNNKPCN